MRGPLAALAACLALGACAKDIPGIDDTALSDAVGKAIGDPSTCVILATKEGDVAWRYGTHMTCSRELPACDQAGGKITVEALAKQAAQGDARAISCPSTPDGLRSVGWATGPVQAGEGKTHGPLAYAAVMEGERALPGREIKLRLENALADAGL
jgi:hypothetical protein